ncbi:MAG: 2TM domain-containing protein [Deltaproteobacteria bacterium]|nr:2TM domain-containing protein [Deltaproteobacteria bacterium]
MTSYKERRPGDHGEMEQAVDRRSKIYSPDEVSRILKRALRPEDENAISHRELYETAQELGVSPNLLDAAIAHEMAGMDMEQARDRWLNKIRGEFNNHLWSYIIVNTALLLINIFTILSLSGNYSIWWFQWPLLGWGIGLAFHIRATFFPSDESIQEGAEKLMAESKKRNHHRD